MQNRIDYAGTVFQAILSSNGVSVLAERRWRRLENKCGRILCCRPRYFGSKQRSSGCSQIIAEIDKRLPQEAVWQNVGAIIERIAEVRNALLA